jgi:hypothetical protein
MRLKLWYLPALVIAITALAAPSKTAPRFARGTAQSADAKSGTPADAIGHWHGFWAAPGGWSYEVDMQIHAGLADNITADLTWTLRAAPASRTDTQGKIGMSGVEHAKGTFSPGCSVVKMDGYALDDPNAILGTDKYRLVLSDDGATLGGITWDQGAWDAEFMAKRQPD